MSVPLHPHGVKPEGMLWMMEANSKFLVTNSRFAGLGKIAALDDATVLRILTFVGAVDLSALCATSTAFHAFASFEELWQAACLRRASGQGFADFRREPFTGYCGSSWKATYFAAMCASAGLPAPLHEVPLKRPIPVFSDTLYRPHELMHTSSAFGSSPKGPPCLRLSYAAVPDLHGFSSTFEASEGCPVVLEGASKECTSSKTWDEATLREELGDRVFHAGGVNMRLREYFDYAHTNNDEQPLYCFDPTFGNTAPELLQAYKTPVYFCDDLFSLLGDSRPDYRWLLIGGLRSGQSWHKDPNGTSAWNLTIRGRKRWLFFPPKVTPPGVIMSGDDGDFVTPVSLAEWARAFYKEACRTPGFIECETAPGDVMYVPRGWWHMVLNVAPITIAVSHHFLSPTGLYNTLRMLRETPGEVSGIDRGLAPRTSSGVSSPDAAAEDHARRTAAGHAMHDKLMAALSHARPDVLASAEAELRRRDESRSRKKKAPLMSAREAKSDTAVPFAFNFI